MKLREEKVKTISKITFLLSIRTVHNDEEDDILTNRGRDPRKIK